MNELFRQLLETDIPVIEHVTVTFLLQNVSVAFREQMVRHRIGIKVGEGVGVDMIPDQHDSAWWIQSMRVLDMGNFCDNGMYEVPEAVLNNPNAMADYKDAMASVQHVYRALVGNGVPVEDARMVLPLGVTHDVTWTMNLMALKHVTSKRSCWIPQLGFWKPIVVGMISEMVQHVHPLFELFGMPPCWSSQGWTRCHFNLDNTKRYENEDPLPPCPIWMAKNGHTPRQYGGSKDTTAQRMRDEFFSRWPRAVTQELSPVVPSPVTGPVGAASRPSTAPVEACEPSFPHGLGARARERMAALREGGSSAD